MNRLGQAVWATSMMAVSLPALAQTQKLYFNQQGRVTPAMSSVAYVREYRVQQGVAHSQDFYYPSMKKYSDPYQVPAGQIQTFVPVLSNGVLTLWYFNGQKKNDRSI